MTRDWLGFGLLTNLGEGWHKRRKLLTPTFHYDILKDFVEVFNQQGRILAQKFAKKCEIGKSFDAYPDVALCALDIICETAMGRNLGTQNDGESLYVNVLQK